MQHTHRTSTSSGRTKKLKAVVIAFVAIAFAFGGTTATAVGSTGNHWPSSHIKTIKHLKKYNAKFLSKKGHPHTKGWHKCVRNLKPHKATWRKAKQSTRKHWVTQHCHPSKRKSITKPVRKPERKPVAKPVRKPVTKPVAKPVTPPVKKPVTPPVVKPGGDSIATVPSKNGCAAAPSACGFPDATNTGVKSGVALKALTDGAGWTASGGSVTITKDGTVFENTTVSGHINVEASNVTIRNVRVLNNGEDWGIGLMKGVKNTTISDSEIIPSGSRLLVGIKDVYGSARGTKIQRNEIVRTTTGVQTHEGLIEGNYIHDMAFKTGDHLNGTTSNGSTVPLTIRHNTIFNQFGQTDAISLFQDFGLEANRVIDNNLLAGGGYTIYGGQNAGAPTAYNIKITDNRISRMFFPKGGSYGPIAAFNSRAPGNIWSGNVWDDSGAAIKFG